MTSTLQVVLFLVLMSPLAVRGQDDESFNADVFYSHIQGSCHLGEYLCVYDCCYYAWGFRNKCCHYKPWSPCCLNSQVYAATVTSGAPDHHHHEVPTPAQAATHTHVQYPANG